MTLLVVAGLIGVLICGCATYFLYRMGAPAGYKKLGLISVGVAGGFALLAASGVFDDEAFSKADARELLQQQRIELQDDFTILANKSTSSHSGDYYHSFTLRISAADRARLAQAISQAPGFESSSGPMSGRYKYNPANRHGGPTIVRNYGTARHLHRELFHPNAAGYAPTYRVIAVAKDENTLVFTDFNE